MYYDAFQYDWEPVLIQRKYICFQAMLEKTKKVPQKISMLRHKNEGLSTSFLGVFFPTPPLLIPHFYVIEGLSSSSEFLILKSRK